MSNPRVTLEWFGTTTFRLRAAGLTIFLDTYLERPSVLPRFLSIDDVTECDYIFISHAHFDHLPGADRLALRTGAIVVANGEAIRCLRQAGVPDAQLYPVQGGERIPLFTQAVRDRAAGAGQGTALTSAGPGPPGRPHHSLAALAAHVWPGLHCLMPPPARHADLPDVLDTGAVYAGEAHPYVCTLEQTWGMQHGLLRMSADDGDAKTRAFVDFVADRERNVFSHFDGGQLMVNFVFLDGCNGGDTTSSSSSRKAKAVLWSSHLGAYEGVVKALRPRPQLAILGIAGRANLDGRPFDGSAAEFALRMVEWLGCEPKRIVWCLQDECSIKPFRVDTTAATELVEKNTDCRVVELEHAKPVEFIL